MIAIVNYGVGNVLAIADIYKRLGKQATLVSSPDDLARANHIILPGVGAFDWAMKRLSESGLRPALQRAVVDQKCPVLGICVGMQMMAHRSEEGRLAGLGWVEGDVVRFENRPQAARLPHMGWNDVFPVGTNPLFANLGADAKAYFLHSYYFKPDRPADVVVAETEYSQRFASAISAGNVHGVQFHPEKSHQWGVRLLENFANL